MFVKHLQEYLDQFTDGKKGNNDLEEIIQRLKDRIKDLEAINESHRKLNGELREELENVRKASTRVS